MAKVKTKLHRQEVWANDVPHLFRPFLPTSITAGVLGDYYSIHAFPGGSHRFERMEESLEMLREHAAR
ncbi:hypothetical protein [Marinobacter sp. LV10R510-11A]|uniref:hypothetical protein n=1 Tax=Marinobacter sp. LV10R510-11A TaxID=1415568 RepID=UPI000BB8F0E1|nr:hypothetical protein [Marinobacter sp. LV10R510-11A]